MKQRITLYAEDGMVLTNGEHYGKIIHLSIDANPSDYYEISYEEYKNILNEQNKSVE